MIFSIATASNTINITIHDEALAHVSESLLSFTVEIGQLYTPDRICNLSSPYILNLAKQLEPHVIRVGGTRGDSFYYAFDSDSQHLPPG